MENTLQKGVAELVGTFALTFIGGGYCQCTSGRTHRDCYGPWPCTCRNDFLRRTHLWSSF